MARNRHTRDSAPEAPPAQALAFDDEPLDRLLYGAAGPGPSTASVFSAAQPVLVALTRAARDRDTARALRLAATLFEDGVAVPAAVLADVITLLKPIIPEVPCPIVPDHGVAYELILEPIFRISARGHEPASMVASGTLLYRWYESSARYADARTVIAALLTRARQHGELVDVAVLTNNLGYEYLLECAWSRGEPLFRWAAQLFADCGRKVDRANALANRLMCEYDASGGGATVESEARELLSAMQDDWRRRKLLRLLARIEERRHNVGAAIALAEQAVRAAHGVPSKHRLDDQSYLARLLGGQRNTDPGPDQPTRGRA